ncbi:MAG: ABC transporter permease [Clostridiales bacterium]|nr:ABC transporter permease [Clostridiales bacterium]
MRTLITSSLKLLFRNKSFWFFLVIVPILSTFVLNQHQMNSISLSKQAENKIAELDSVDDKVAYYGGHGEFVIKVYDACGSELSEYMLTKLSRTGAFSVVRAKAPDMDREAADKKIEHDGEFDRMGAALYIPQDFDRLLMEGKEDEALTLYVLSDDGRIEMLEYSVKKELSLIKKTVAEWTSTEAVKLLNQKLLNTPEKEIVKLSGGSSRSLTQDQENRKTAIGYAIAFMTLGYVFCGIFIAHTVIKDEHDKVLTRLRLTGMSSYKYFASKFVISVIATFLMTVVLGAFSFMIDTEKFGIGRAKFLLMMFLLGLIFSSISLVIGVILGDVMNANIAAFALFSLSSLLAGTFFPMDATSSLIKALSSLMPQKWFLDATEMIFLGDGKAYLVLLCVTASYLLLTLSLGGVGIKVRNGEE